MASVLKDWNLSLPQTTLQNHTILGHPNSATLPVIRFLLFTSIDPVGTALVVFGVLFAAPSPSAPSLRAKAVEFGRIGLVLFLVFLLLGGRFVADGRAPPLV